MKSDPQDWYLRKRDGSEFGPVTLARLRQWAADCRLVPGNAVSRDREEWIPVEEVQALEMDWMARRPDGCEYGPFNIRAVPELYRHGALPDESVLRHERTQETVALADALARLNAESAGRPGGPPSPRPESGEEPATDFTDPPAPPPPTPPPAADEATPAPPDAERNDADRAETEGELARLRSALEDQRAESARALDAREAEWQARLEAAEQTNQALLDDLARLEATARQAEALQAEREQMARNQSESEAEAARQEAQLQETIQTLKQGQARNREDAQQARHDLEDALRQLAFMKKNHGMLLTELDAQKRLGKRLLRCVVAAAVVMLLLLAGWIVCSRRLRPAAPPPSIAAPLPPPWTPPPPAAPSPPRAPVATAPATTAQVPAPTPRPVPAPRPAPAPTWPSLDLPGVTVRRGERTMSLIFEEPVFSRMTALSEWGRGTLRTLATELKPHLATFSLTVTGHTDNIPLSSTTVFESNDHLAQARAEAVAQYLIQSCGLPASALRTASEGDRNPPYPNDTPASRRRNRTVVLHLQPR